MPRLAYVSDLFVRPDARRRGIAKGLLGELLAIAGERGAGWIELDVDVDNSVARIVWERLGFRPHALQLAAEVPALADRLEHRAVGATFGSVHVQTDHEDAVRSAVERFIPRLGRSAGTDVVGPRNGWVAVYDELCDREPRLLRRLGRELSDRMGAVVVVLGVEDGAVARYVLFDRGRIADEYASVPEYHGPLPPGDVVALGANPTVAQRLTGADPAHLRAAARTAGAPDDLPPARELLRDVAAALGIEGGDHGYEGST
jgi:hypothetical protein